MKKKEIIKKIKKIDTDMLKDICMQLNNKYTLQEDLVFDLCLDELLSRLPGAEFVKFANFLEVAE